MEHCGIDLHQKNSEIFVVNDEGEVMERVRLSTTRRALTRFFEMRPRMRVVMEAGGSSQWVSRIVEKANHELVLCAPRRVRLIAESTLKSDQIDAEVLARLGRIDPGFLGRVRHSSEEAQMLRARMTSRSALVGARVKWVNTVRGILRGFGYRVSSGTTGAFPERCRKVELPEELQASIEPLLKQIEVVTEQIKSLEEELKEICKDHPVVELLRTIAGVGMIVALYFVLLIDDPDRFHRSRDVAAFFGLRPAVRGSGDVQYYGKITKEGNREMRRLLIQAAHVLQQSKRSCALKDWAEAVEKRRGKGKATVALARKLAILMHHLWVTGAVFEDYPGGPATANRSTTG